MNTYDVCIVGAGVVGCVIARELGRRRRDAPLRIIVLEQHERAGEETSRRNSGVLHSGIHERPFSLKERLAREGSALAVSYAVQQGIPLLRTGMVIAISREDIRRGLWREVASLRRLWFNAWKTKTRVMFVTSSGLRAWEPHLRACCGIVIPSVSVIDPHAFAQSLKADSEATGAHFAFNNWVIGIDIDTSAYIVTTERQRIRATCLINAAGLYADDVAGLALRKTTYTIHPLRGEYYELVPSSRDSLEHAQLLIDKYRIPSETIDITDMADPLIKGDSEYVKRPQGKYHGAYAHDRLVRQNGSFQRPADWHEQ